MGGHHHAHDHGGRQGSELAGAAFRWSIALNSGLTASVQPHRQKTFKLSTDPFFVEKVRDIVALYLNPPDKAMVLCVDEKTQIQALDRTQPLLPMGLGYVEGVTHDYIRHGTTTLFAALDVATGEVITQCKPRHRHQEFLGFLRQIEKSVPADLDVHLIVDNYCTHKHAKVRAWLAQRPRFHVHYTPTYASWLNQVERCYRFAGPLDFLGRLAALTPKPRVNLLLYHGVFAPHAARRRGAVARAREAAENTAATKARAAPAPQEGRTPTPAGGRSPEEETVAPHRKSGWVKWADLLRRVFEIDVLACARCGGRLRFVAAIDDPEAIRRILGHLGLPTSITPPLPARPPPGGEQASFD